MLHAEIQFYFTSLCWYSASLSAKIMFGEHACITSDRGKGFPSEYFAKGNLPVSMVENIKWHKSESTSVLSLQ